MGLQPNDRKNKQGRIPDKKRSELLSHRVKGIRTMALQSSFQNASDDIHTN